MPRSSFTHRKSLKPNRVLSVQLLAEIKPRLFEIHLHLHFPPKQVRFKASASSSQLQFHLQVSRSSSRTHRE